MDSCAEAARARDEFGQLQISFSPSGFLYLIPTLHVRTSPTGPHPLRAKELTTPHPESLTTRLVPVEVDLKQQIFDVCSSPRLCCKSRKSSDPKNLAKVDF